MDNSEQSKIQNLHIMIINFVYKTCLKISAGRPSFRSAFMCRSCEFITSSKLLLIVHKLKCTKPKRFHCKICHFSSNFSGNLIRHKKDLHSTAKPIKWLQCDHCEHKTKRKGDLKRHIIGRHSHPGAPKPKNWLICTKCDYATPKKTGMLTHFQRKHTPKKMQQAKFSCQFCSRFKTTTKDNLRSHILFKHTPTENIQWLECKYCTYKAKITSDLRSHVIFRHTSDADTKWFECGQCCYKTKKNGHLKRHQRRHES